MSGATRLFPPHAFMAWTGTASVYFYLLNQLQKIKGITQVCRWRHGKVTQVSSCSSLSSPTDPLAHISTDFPSLAQRDVNPPPPPILRRRSKVREGVLQTRTPFCDMTPRHCVIGFRRHEKTPSLPSRALGARRYVLLFETSARKTFCNLWSSAFWP